MTDRESFVSRLILEAETPLEREAVTELQIAGLELIQARARITELENTVEEMERYGAQGEYR